MYIGKAHATGESQSGSGQTDKSPEVVIDPILVGDGKEVMISQIVNILFQTMKMTGWRTQYPLAYMVRNCQCKNG